VNQHRYDAIAKALGATNATPELTSRLLRGLYAHWSEQHRHYHGVNHLERVLNTLDMYRRLYNGPLPKISANRPWVAADLAEFALLYHDAVYSAHAARGDNEKNSAELAAQDARALGIPLCAISYVIRSILATDYHDAIAGRVRIQDYAECSVIYIVWGCDLAPLADSLAVFREDTENVWKEYGPPTPAMECRRAEFLYSISAFEPFRQIPVDGSNWFRQFETPMRRNVLSAMLDALRKAQVALS